MAIAAVDNNKILREHLVATGTDLYGLVATRVYVERLPKGYDPDTKALVISIRGGDRDFQSDMVTASVVIQSYGGSQNLISAFEVDRAVVDVLHGINMVTVSSGIIMSAEQDTIGQSLIDPETEWVSVISTYTVQMRAV